MVCSRRNVPQQCVVSHARVIHELTSAAFYLDRKETVLISKFFVVELIRENVPSAVNYVVAHSQRKET